MTDVLLELLDQNWNRQAVTGNLQHVSITKELGQVGSAEVVLPASDPLVPLLPDPDATNRYEGRFRLYEDGALKFAGVIDATTVSLNENEATVTFGGKHRGIEIGFYNTGRRDFLGWSLPELYRELLRDNIAKSAVLYSVSSEDELYAAYAMVSGDPYKANYWKSTTNVPNHEVIWNLGEQKQIDAIRVMPQWWKDIDTLRFHRHQFVVYTGNSPAGPWTTKGTKSDQNPSSAKGHLYETPGTTAQYVRLVVTGSSDGYARIAQLLIYQDIADIGGDTSYVVPFVENDDSGNTVHGAGVTRPIVPGAFQGDGVVAHSYVTQLDSGTEYITHTFRGVSSGVYFTSHTDGASVARIYIDGGDRGTVNIPDGRYWYKGYDTIDDLGLLSNGQHTMKVEHVSGTVNVDYYNGLYETSWRPIEDDDPAIGYVGSWEAVQAEYYFNYFAAKSAEANNKMSFAFKGDRIRIMGSKVPGGGSFTAYMDGVSQGTISTANASQVNKTQFYEWTGTYGDHELLIITNDSNPIYFDRLEGNFAHTLYIRARYESNLKVLIRMSEIVDSYLRFNDDGSVDLLGAVGDPSGTVIREGENIGGTIINLNKEHDYTETGSVCLALVNVNGELPIKAMVIDYEAMAEIGYKLIKLENSDAADQFLLNRQALQYLRDHRLPKRSYTVSFPTDEVGELDVGYTTRLYSPTAGLSGESFRAGKLTTEYSTQ